MGWLGAQVRERVSARTYVLAGLLVLALLWAHSMGGGSRSPDAPSGAAVPGPAGPASGAGVRARDAAGPSTPTPEGWGRDPFDRKFGPPRGGDR